MLNLREKNYNLESVHQPKNMKKFSILHGGRLSLLSRLKISINESSSQNFFRTNQLLKLWVFDQTCKASY